jgi:hypothetical protein
LKSLTAEFEIQKRRHLDSMQEQEERIASITTELESVKSLNHTLMEDNEGYQILLTEKTMSGEFLKVCLNRGGRMRRGTNLICDTSVESRTRRINVPGN